MGFYSLFKQVIFNKDKREEGKNGWRDGRMEERNRGWERRRKENCLVYFTWKM
jgi:hypothetical protein